MADDPRPQDLDPVETLEWREALAGVLRHDGPERARFLLQALGQDMAEAGSPYAAPLTTPYVNTLAASQQVPRPGDPEMERRIKNIVRWNAVAMVVRANKRFDGLGGHLSSYASAATLYEVGFNHCFQAPSDEHGGDLIYVQGHCAPGIYARAFLEGRLSAEQLDGFRREVDGKGLSSYPHPWLMKDFWQFATVSMGLGPHMAIYQARFLRYLEARGLAQTANRHVWAFLGDGEMDEPESLGAITVAGREKLDNLIFVINCNLQRLDGPVRGNGKIIQELEAVFRGAGWNVLKLLWGSNWDPLLESEHGPLLQQRMMEAVDGEYQAFKANDGAYVRERFFGKYPQLADLVSGMSDQEVWRLKRGGHDPDKVYAAYAAALAHRGQPTVILAKTVKGYGLGEAAEGQNTAHQQKKLQEEAIRIFRDRFQIPLTDAELAEVPYYHPGVDSPEVRYIQERRQALGGPWPARRRQGPTLEVPKLETLKAVLGGSGERQMSTTMAFVRILSTWLRDKTLGPHLVPIVADEARTFGMEGLFRQLAIYAPFGQKYEPVDAGQLAYYREARSGQLLQEGISEAGALSSWSAAATSYSHSGVPTVPFFIYYSMFGFQRVGDFIWASADMQARGFLLGGTSGRTTLNGEGLQHQDGHSHLLSATVPNCRSYDPTYSYELAVIMQDGLRRMLVEQENVFYYLTTMNENYPHPAMPEGAEEGILRGMYRLPGPAEEGSKDGRDQAQPWVQLLGSGTILREVEAAAEILRRDYGVGADVWSVTSFTELRRDGLEIDRHRLLEGEGDGTTSYVEQCLAARPAGPVIAATDYMKAWADGIRAWVRRPYYVLGTDGFGRSDTREQLRRFFEVDRGFVVVSALRALASEGKVESSEVERALREFAINQQKPDPTTL